MLSQNLAPRPATADQPSGSMPVRLLAFKPLAKGSLRGFVKVQLGKSLIINDVTVLTANGKAWCGMPGKPQIGADGQVLRDGAKIKYTPVVEWADRDASSRFSEAVIAAVLAEYPDALDDGGTP